MSRPFSVCTKSHITNPPLHTSVLICCSVRSLLGAPPSRFLYGLPCGLICFTSPRYFVTLLPSHPPILVFSSDPTDFTLHQLIALLQYNVVPDSGISHLTYQCVLPSNSDWLKFRIPPPARPPAPPAAAPPAPPASAAIPAGASSAAASSLKVLIYSLPPPC